MKAICILISMFVFVATTWATPWTEKEQLALKQCKKFRPAHDGDWKGFLFKTSDVPDYGGVVLLPENWKPVKTMRVWHAKHLVDTFFNWGHFTEDGGNRPLWRSWKKPALTYPEHVVLSLDNGRICIKINNPRVRND